MILIRQIETYTPTYLGKKDILTGGGKIISICDHLDFVGNPNLEVIDGTGLMALPGLIDAHVHIAGAGGEGGPATRTAGLRISDMLEAGVTTVVGCLGTDGYTRSVESVLMKVKSIRHEGLSAWMFTGAYQIPPPSILENVGKDIAMIEEIIGVGEVALSDHRSSYPTTQELIRLASMARVGGMLGNKCGIVNIHMGDAKDPFRPLYDASTTSEIPLKQFWPTHCNRNHHIFEDAKEYGKKGYLDLTASSYPYFPEFEIKPSKAIAELLRSGVPLQHITLTSDACGSLPDFDEQGNLVKLEMGYPLSVFTEIRDSILEEKMSISDAFSLATSNVAGILKLAHKGRIQENNDADLLILDKELNIIHVLANGSVMVRNGNILKKGAYE
ncbi:MAG: beta-aspartyl-peptidase [Bacteroidetes bacterium]|nr:beta-aspartyl-peptidase [Bacteroidota bacterium]